jgi:plasmid maintenance system antidote protein VapI
MTHADSNPAREDVLYAFAVEPTAGRDTLERYLRDYPEYTNELIDLAYELSREVGEDETLLSDGDHALINWAWQQYAEAAPKEMTKQLTALSIAEQRELAERLEVPRQVITAFREYRVEITSVPISFLERFASALNSTVETLRRTLVLQSESDLARSYKADDRPVAANTQVSFEQILIEANVSPEKQALLLADGS